jgi:hypothetical protein
MASARSTDLGVSAAAVGFISGLGRWSRRVCGISPRFLADRTRMLDACFAGCALNLIAIPASSSVRSGRPPMLVVASAPGNASRAGPRCALSEATAVVGHGWGFGITPRWIGRAR